MEFSKLLEQRRSIRAYKSEQIDEKQMDHVLQAALYAPTGRNFQSTIMVAVQDKELVAKLNTALAK